MLRPLDDFLLSTGNTDAITPHIILPTTSKSKDPAVSSITVLLSIRIRFATLCDTWRLKKKIARRRKPI